MANNIYSVTQLNKYIKDMIKNDYFLQRICVKGEVSNLTYHSSGHIYFSLKDETGIISCAMWASSVKSGLSFRLKEGLQVIVDGSCDVFEKQGKYQLIARTIRQDGVGDLAVRFEALKKKLEEMGMFAKEYKKPIPEHVKTLGVVTAPTGAAIRDIIDVSKRRNPGIQIILYPAIVQGDDAPLSIVKGIEALSRYGVDCMIVGRGGGSMEDLWGFNDERVAQAIFDCDVPVISAVGHEIDFTIADFVSDLRAPTPSAAAELAVCDISESIKKVENLKMQLERGIYNTLNGKKVSLKTYSEKLTFLSPSNQIKIKRDKLKEYSEKLEYYSPQKLIDAKRKQLMLSEERLNSFMEKKLDVCKNRLSLVAQKLHGLSPLNKLGGGYAYVEVGDISVKGIDQIKKDDELKVTFTDGQAVTKVIETRRS